MTRAAKLGWRPAMLATLACVTMSAQVHQTQIDSIFVQLKSANAPGAAVLVVRDGKIVLEQGYGLGDLRSHVPITAETNFRLASCTKQFTAMAIMLLAHDGKLRYDQTLSQIFPEFPAYGETITIRQLLNHTSGLKDYEDLLNAQYPHTPDEKIPQIHDAEVLKLMERQTATDFPPGSQWRYSNSGYVLLGLVVEKVSGVPFGGFLQERVFAPLKMTNSILYEKGKNDVAHRAYGHTFARGKWKQTDQSSTSATLGDGGIYSSIDDLAKWDAALASCKLLSEKEMRDGLTPVRVPAAKDASAPLGNQSYGFGWFLDPYKGHRRTWHYGETVGFRTTIQRFPDDELTVIVLANRSDVNPQELALKVADLYLGGTSAKQP